MVNSWIVTDGKPGMESQCLGLADALEISPVVKRLLLRRPWGVASPFIRLPPALSYDDVTALQPPWPDLLIATGRQSVQASLFVRQMSRRSGHPCVTVQIQNPVISPRHFDLVITPAHDQLIGKNVLATLGALHRITPQKLEQAMPLFLSRIGPLPRPYITVLLGGANGSYQFSLQDMHDLAQGIVTAVRECHGSVLVTPSRRTSTAHLLLLQRSLAEFPSFIWDGAGDNPYFGMLAAADRIVVTSDSVNMVSEAVASGKPVQVFELKGGSAKFAFFHRSLRTKGLTSAFPGPLPTPIPGIESDMARAVQRVREVYRAVRGASL
jgi:mitochondrial fission protein ELM1